jgi:predicted ester cyclase
VALAFALANFREHPMPEAYFPRRPLLGSSLNSGEPPSRAKKTKSLMRVR